MALLAIIFTLELLVLHVGSDIENLVLTPKSGDCSKIEGRFLLNLLSALLPSLVLLFLLFLSLSLGRGGTFYLGQIRLSKC